MRILIIICLAALQAAASVTPDSLLTTAEISGYKRTGRHDETERLVNALAKTFPKQARRVDVGTSPEGRSIPALVLSNRKAFEPKKAREQNLPVVMFQGGIHSGEIEGKDAGFEVAREILRGNLLQGVLESVVLVFVPILNVDGHERFGPNNRPNQNGPEEMGWRTTAQNLNLNRDYLKADAPEMEAMLRFLHAWDPILYVDLHTTDGAKFQHDIAVMVQPSREPTHPLSGEGQRISSAIMRDLALEGHLPLPFYPSFRREDNPASGINTGVAPPRFSHGYWGIRNRFGVLVETHSWKDYKARLIATRHAVEVMLRLAMEHGQEWLRLAREADARDTERARERFALAFRATEPSTTFPFQGYAYQRTESDVSGQTWIQYDTERKEIWNFPLYTNVIATVSATLPGRGYIIPAAWRQVVEPKLRAHGVVYQIMERAEEEAVESFRADEVEFGAAPFEGRQRVTLKGSWKSDKQTLPAGSIIVPIEQRLARLVMHLFEPDAPDSLVSWGMFNSAFERKEYLEDYVTEQVAREMLATNAAVKADFERLLQEPNFATNSAKRLEFFYRRHPSWDERYFLYPVYRLERD